MEMIPQEGIRQMLRFQIFGRIHSVQEMMLNAVKNAQREFPSVIYFREEASKLIKVGDKGDFFYSEAFWRKTSSLISVFIIF